MLATITRMASAEYYLGMTENLRHPGEYYIGGLEPDGVWFNLNNHLDIANGSTVSPEDFKSLFSGFSPNGDKLTQNAGKEQRASGLDMTFSADKTISSYWAIATPEEREIIEQSMQEAVNETLKYLAENGSYCRRGRDGVILEQCDFIAATFLHSTSREMDPQLHIHTTIMNVAFHQDGTTGSIHQPSFYQKYKSLGAIATFKLSQKLNQNLGLNFESHGSNNEFRRIKGFPKDLVDLWSKRRKAILQRAGELGAHVSSNAKAMATIAISSRPEKDQDCTRERLLERFEQEALGLGYMKENIQEFLSKQVEFNRQEVWDKMQVIPAELCKSEAFFVEDKLIEKVYRSADIAMTEEEVMGYIPRLTGNNKLVYLGANKVDQKIYSTPEMIFAEKDVSRLALELSEIKSYKVSQTSIEKCLKDLEASGISLSGEQVVALKNATLKTGSISITEGAAGAGKSVVLAGISDIFKHNGFKVIGASTTWRVTSELGNDCGIDSYAIDKLLIIGNGDSPILDNKTVLIVDEAGTLSTDKTRQILQQVKDAGAKVILVGDREQQQAIEAGSGLRLCEEVVGSIRIDQIRRQSVTPEDVLVYRDRAGPLSPETARLQLSMMSGEDKDNLVEIYGKEVSEKGVVWQRNASTLFKEGEAFKAIEMYYDRGHVHFGKTYSNTIWKMCNEYVTWVHDHPGKTSIVQARTNKEASDISSALRKIYRANGGITGGDVEIEVAGKDKNETGTLALARGDVFRFGCLNKSLGVVNGTLASVVRIEETAKGTRIVADVEGRSVDFLVDEMKNFDGDIALKQGYVTTFYSAQGMSVDASFQLIDHSLMRENMYSAATRHKNAAHFYLNRELSLEFTTERLTEEELKKPVRDKKILEVLAAKWSVSASKELAHDYMDEQTKQIYQDFYDQLVAGKSIESLLGEDIQQREVFKAQELYEKQYIGGDLDARKRVGLYGQLRVQSAILGESIRNDLGKDGVFYGHKDYVRYLEVRAQADAVAAEIADDIEIHRGGLTTYPNVTDEQLNAARSRHTARSLVAEWHTAHEAKREATADKLADEIIGIVKAEKGKTGEEASPKFMAAAIRQSGISDGWDKLYRGHEDHRERYVREALSGGACYERERALDYRRSAINVGRIYGNLRERAGENINLSDVQGYEGMLGAMKQRDSLAALACDVSRDVLKDFNISPDKLAEQARAGEARKLVNMYSLKDSTGNVEGRDSLAAEIMARVQLEKAAWLEDRTAKKITSKSVMEKGLDWKVLFGQVNADKERQYMNALSPQEAVVHRDMKLYQAHELEVGKLYREAITEGQDTGLERDQTDAWKLMQVFADKRDRMAHSIVSQAQKTGVGYDQALGHYRRDHTKLEARADRIEAGKLFDIYQGYKLDEKILNAGEIAGEILARYNSEKLDEKPRITAREIFARNIEWSDLYQERSDFNAAVEEAMNEFEAVEPEMKGFLDKYIMRLNIMDDKDNKITSYCDENSLFIFAHEDYDEWFGDRTKFDELGRKALNDMDDLRPIVRVQYKGTFARIHADLDNYEEIDARHESELEQYEIQEAALEIKEAVLEIEEKEVKRDISDDEDYGKGYGF